MLIADGTSTEEIIEMDREDGMRARSPAAGRMWLPTAAPRRALSKAILRRTTSRRDPAYRWAAGKDRKACGYRDTCCGTYW